MIYFGIPLRSQKTAKDWDTVVRVFNRTLRSVYRQTDPDFARALEEAAAAGVRILALECRVTPDTLEITGEIPVRIYEGASELWDGRNIRK